MTTSSLQGMRASFYAYDGSNNPPPSPTAKWKAEVHAHVDFAKTDPRKQPYLPDPYPLQRVGRRREGHPGGFTSLREPLQPAKNPDQAQVYCSYAEWWQAQRPSVNNVKARHETFSTSFWPFGHRVSNLSSIDDEGTFYQLDQRRIKNHIGYKEKREPSTLTLPSRSRSTADFFGSHSEHLRQSQSLASSMTTHAGAAFHEKNKLAASMSTGSLKKNVWEHRVDNPDAVALQRCPSAPSTARSMQATVGSSRYDPKRSLRDMGLASRTHAEFRLPQPTSANGL